MRTLKASLVGSECIGKSSLARAIAEEKFEGEYISTIGADIRHRYLREDGIKIFCWDLAGQDRFSTIIESYISTSPVLLACYDSSNYTSYTILKQRLEILRQAGHLYRKHIVVVSLKNDLTSLRDEQWGMELASMLLCPFYKVSSKTGKGVKELLGELVCIGHELFPRYLELEECDEKRRRLCFENCIIL